MASPDVLASTGTKPNDGTLATSTPGTPGNGSNAIAVPPSGQAQTPQPATTQVVKVGNESLTPAQIEAKLTEANVALAKYNDPVTQERLKLVDAYGALSPVHQQVIGQTLEMLSRGENPLERKSGREMVVADIDVPVGATLPSMPSWDDLTDEGKSLYATISGVHNDLLDKMREIGAAVSNLNTYVGQLHTRSMDDNAAQAMRIYGFNVDGAQIAKWREMGISNPVQAAANGLLKAPEAVPTTLEVQTGGAVAPPEPGMSTVVTSYDANDPKITFAMKEEFHKKGIYPQDPKDVERLKQLGVITA